MGEIPRKKFFGFLILGLLAVENTLQWQGGPEESQKNLGVSRNNTGALSLTHTPVPGGKSLPPPKTPTVVKRDPLVDSCVVVDSLRKILLCVITFIRMCSYVIAHYQWLSYVHVDVCTHGCTYMVLWIHYYVTLCMYYCVVLYVHYYMHGGTLLRAQIRTHYCVTLHTHYSTHAYAHTTTHTCMYRYTLLGTW